jgi:hypothetical protein
MDRMDQARSREDGSIDLNLYDASKEFYGDGFEDAATHAYEQVQAAISAAEGESR